MPSDDDDVARLARALGLGGLKYRSFRNAPVRRSGPGAASARPPGAMPAPVPATADSQVIPLAGTALAVARSSLSQVPAGAGQEDRREAARPAVEPPAPLHMPAESQVIHLPGVAAAAAARGGAHAVSPVFPLLTALESGESGGALAADPPAGSARPETLHVLSGAMLRGAGLVACPPPSAGRVPLVPTYGEFPLILAALSADERPASPVAGFPPPVRLEEERAGKAAGAPEAGGYPLLQGALAGAGGMRP